MMLRWRCGKESLRGKTDWILKVVLGLSQGRQSLGHRGRFHPGSPGMARARYLLDTLFVDSRPNNQPCRPRPPLVPRLYMCSLEQHWTGTPPFRLGSLFIFTSWAFVDWLDRPVGEWARRPPRGRVATKDKVRQPQQRSQRSPGPKSPSCP